MLQQRAHLYRRVRQFFSERSLLEVQPSLLIQHPVTDAHVHNLAVTGHGFLHSSPEFQMKRLLAAGSGDIYSLGPVFRADEQGRKHNVEFIMLEWYRLGVDHQQLMLEVVELLEYCAQQPLGYRVYDYGQLFHSHFDRCPHQSDDAALQQLALDQGAPSGLDRSGCLDYLMSVVIEPGLPLEQLSLVVHYPECQAALSRLVRRDDTWQASRFELYWRGMELANGYHELCDPAQQQQRMSAELAQRNSATEPDPMLLAALAEGLPDCAGVALGVDRLLMALTRAEHLAEVQAFQLPHA